ncbi:MAG: hypothetical protein IJG84_02895 [Kiritimatiellae bacterium]|nr:hypothetical protein [Kiritimatiellia bacterium]
MKSLTAYFGDRGKMCPMVLLVDGELKRNAEEVSSAAHLNERDKEMLARWIADARACCAAVLDAEPPLDSVRGATVRKNVYQSLRSDVDVVTKCERGSFANTEIKYAIKPYSFGPFANATLFVSRIAVKFDQLEKAMAEDGEQAGPFRIILVAEEHVDSLRTAIHDLGETGESFATDGLPHQYLLCSLRGLVEFMSGTAAADSTLKFEL